jgi:arsenite oxidase small subunit
MGISRRNLAKGLVALSTVLVVAPFGALYKYLSVPVPTIKIAKTKIANRSEVPAGDAIRFSFPTEDRPAILIHLRPGEYEHGDYREGSQNQIINDDRFVAYDGVCTHLGCPANWKATDKETECPCHGGGFSPLDGTVLKGPPPRPIPKIKLEIDETGDIYAVGYESGLPLFGMESFQFESE